jgi:hypothetical protein
MQEEGPKALPLWRQNADREGEVSVLVWGGIGHATALWQRRHAVLFRGSLNLLAAADSQQVLSAQPLRHDRCLAAAVRGADRLVLRALLQDTLSASSRHRGSVQMELLQAHCCCSA